MSNSPLPEDKRLALILRKTYEMSLNFHKRISDPEPENKAWLNLGSSVEVIIRTARKPEGLVKYRDLVAGVDSDAGIFITELGVSLGIKDIGDAVSYIKNQSTAPGAEVEDWEFEFGNRFAKHYKGILPLETIEASVKWHIEFMRPYITRRPKFVEEEKVAMALKIAKELNEDSYTKDEFFAIKTLIDFVESRSSLEPLDRELAEKYAQEIWKECATTDAIASYLQKHFGIPQNLNPLDKRNFPLAEIQRKCGVGLNTALKLRDFICTRFGAPGQRVVKWPEKETLCPHQNVNPEQLCLACNSHNEAIDACQQAFKEDQNSARLTDG